MSLVFSAEQKQISSIFKAYRNTIDIYTEDEQKDKRFYDLLLKRLLKDTDIKINDIYPLGCRRTVIDSCKKDTSSDRKKIYIVDGDVYIQYDDKEKVPNLYVLDAYCIENFTICEESIGSLLDSLNGGRCPKEKIVKELDYEKCLKNIYKPLIDLFFHYSIMAECGGKYNIKNIAVYIKKDSNAIDEEIINKEINQLKSGIFPICKSEDAFNDLLVRRKNKFSYSINTLLTIVSGKDFLIPFFQLCINKCLKSNVKLPKEAWKYTLAEDCDLKRLENLKNAIITACV